MLIEGNAGSMGELLAEVERISRLFQSNVDAPEEIWFRGQHACSWDLLPSIYRPAHSRFHYSESSLMNRFAALAAPLVARNPDSDWEWYFLARHHGLPSRLIDWSESVLTAAYFALINHMPEDRLALESELKAPISSCFDDRCPAVWMLDAGTLNLYSIGDDSIIVPGFERSKPYLPDNLDKQHSGSNENPIAVLPARGGARIAAQQGMFTVHGHGKRAIDSIARAEDGVRVGVIRLDYGKRFAIAQELRRLGIHEHSIFPDLDAVARHVCWISQSLS